MWLDDFENKNNYESQLGSKSLFVPLKVMSTRDRGHPGSEVGVVRC